MNYEEYKVKTRNEVIRVANEIIKHLMANPSAVVTIVWGNEKDIKFMQDWKQTKHKPKMTKEEVNLGTVNWLKRRLGMEEI